MNPIALLRAGAAASALLCSHALAQLTLPAIFSDGMVLQRESEVAVWGEARAGDQVWVRGGWQPDDAAPVQVRADAAGRWLVRVPTGEAGGPTTLTVWTADENRTLERVHLGEVFLCSGQSNMEWELRRIAGAVADAEGLAPETQGYQRPDVHFFTVQRRATLEPQEDCVGRWRPAVGDEALDCSAVAYFFACALQDEIGVPVGLVNSSWGGTPVESWVSREVIERFPRHAKTLDLVGADAAAAPTATAVAFWKAVRAQAYWTDAYVEADFDDADWEEQALPGSYKEGPVGEHDGVAWYRRRVALPAAWQGQELRLLLPPVDDLDGTFVNGTLVGTSLARGGWNTPRSYTVPAALTDRDELVITVCALDTGGGDGFGKGSPMALALGGEALELSGRWKVRKGIDMKSVPEIPYTRGVDSWTPSALYAGMIAPVQPYGLRGVLWYQGEANVSLPDEYRLVFPSMILDWRQRWGDPDLAFYLVQLAPFDYGERAGGEDRPVARLRDAQAHALTLPMTGMALTNDIGNPKNIHPVNKWEVGRRLALWALRDHFGGEVDPMGPTVAAAEAREGALRLTFDHAPGGLVRGGDGPIGGFEVCGADGRWVEARAALAADGSSVTLTAEGLAAPARARYLWSDDAEGVLLNRVGLPVAPFEMP